ncbi:unnamed protein product [Psylliodes chrysocephalus]|uniref:Uncharacterized protein n=1 Tax=Psylliodes chrysocephalus TaxID=3402493 RepID=A0A9P0CPZ6_9CUCU|nr:unnamed protein product [Psylliodes chrysocephala]
MASVKTKGSSRFRFTEEFDIHLAREVNGLNPFEDSRRWATIQVNLIQIIGKCINIRTIRERIQNLVKKWLAKYNLMKGRSGMEIQMTELDDLLQQISELMSEFSNKEKKNVLNVPNKTSYVKGFEAREQSCSSFLNEQKGRL